MKAGDRQTKGDIILNSLGVIFDMDGVLVDSAAAHFESWQRLAQERGAGPISEAQFKATFGGRNSEIIAEWFGETDAIRSKALGDRKESLYREIIRHDVRPMPGAKELIDRLAGEGIAMAIGSSGPPENVRMICEAMGLNDAFRAIITGADVSRGKPDPEVFLRAAEGMSLAADQCVVIEDAPLGIEAARRAGMRCVGLTSSHPADVLAGADLIVGSLDEVSSEGLRRLIGSRV